MHRKLAADKLFSESKESFRGTVVKGNFLVWGFGLATYCGMGSETMFLHKTWIYLLGLSVLIAFSVATNILGKQEKRYVENATLISGLMGLILSIECFLMYMDELFKAGRYTLLSGILMGVTWYIGVVVFFLVLRFYVRHSRIKDGGKALNSGLVVLMMLVIGGILKVVAGISHWTTSWSLLVYAPLYLSCVFAIGIAFLPEYWIMRKERLQNEQKARG